MRTEERNTYTVQYSIASLILFNARRRVRPAKTKTKNKPMINDTRTPPDLVNRTPVLQHTLEVGCRIFVQKCVTQFVTHVVSSRCLSFVLRLSQQTFGYAHDTRTRPSFVVSSCVPNSVHTYRTTSLLRIYLHITAYVGMYCKVCPPPMFD